MLQEHWLEMYYIQRSLTLFCMMSSAMEMKSHSPHVHTALLSQTTMKTSHVTMLMLFVRVRININNNFDVSENCSWEEYIIKT